MIGGIRTGKDCAPPNGKMQGETGVIEALLKQGLGRGAVSCFSPLLLVICFLALQVAGQTAGPASQDPLMQLMLAQPKIDVESAVVPTVNFGAGVASCTCVVDKDPFTFGTPFAISLGAGLRYVPGGHFQIRVDLNDYLYQLKTPAAYYINSADNTPVAAQGTARTFWKNNPTLTIGVSRLFFR